jgi:transposase
MEITVLGIDLGKNSCSVVGLDGTGQVVMRRRMQRDSVTPYSFSASFRPPIAF